MTKIAMRVATSAARALQADNLPFQPESTAQLVVAALVGSSVSSYEEAKDLDIPFVVDEPQSSGSGGRAWARQLREDVVLERAGKALNRAYERAGKFKPSKIELEVQKVRAESHVNEHIARHHLYVYTQKLLFSPRYASIATKVLAGMKHPILGAATASAAIACGLIPAPPSRDMKEHLLFLGPLMASGIGHPRATLSSWVAKNQPFVVEFPTPNLEASRDARVDRHFRSGQSMASELGLGFFLVCKDELPDVYVVVTPMLFHRQPLAGASGPWRPEFHKSVVRTHQRTAFKYLQDVLADKKHESAQLKACASCGEIYSNDHAYLQLRCACAN